MTEKQLDWVAIAVILLSGAHFSKSQVLTASQFDLLIGALLSLTIISRIIIHIYAARVIGKRKHVIMWLRTVTDQEWEYKVNSIHESLLQLSGEIIGGTFTNVIMIILVVLSRHFDFHYKAIGIILCFAMFYLMAKFFYKALKVDRNCDI